MKHFLDLHTVSVFEQIFFFVLDSIKLETENLWHLLEPLCLLGSSCFVRQGHHTAGWSVTLFEIFDQTLVLSLPSFIDLFEANHPDKNRRERINDVLLDFQLAVMALKSNDLPDSAFEVFSDQVVLKDVMFQGFILHLAVFEIFVLNACVVHRQVMLL